MIQSLKISVSVKDKFSVALKYYNYLILLLKIFKGRKLHKIIKDYRCLTVENHLIARAITMVR
jgi:hypothetical protein